MKVLVTGACGFVGAALLKTLRSFQDEAGLRLVGIDNLSRNGSWTNRRSVIAAGVQVLHGDIRNASDLEAIGPFDWVIDAAANPSVLAGVDGRSSSRQLIEHNLGGTINLLEACKRWNAGFVLLSTSRVYSIVGLSALPVSEHQSAYRVNDDSSLPPGVSARGVREEFSTQAPISLYGATKLASEQLALEYGHAFNFPVWINRCGVLAGLGNSADPIKASSHFGSTVGERRSR